MTFHVDPRDIVSVLRLMLQAAATITRSQNPPPRKEPRVFSLSICWIGASGWAYESKREKHTAVPAESVAEKEISRAAKESNNCTYSQHVHPLHFRRTRRYRERIARKIESFNARRGEKIQIGSFKILCKRFVMVAGTPVSAWCTNWCVKSVSSSPLFRAENTKKGRCYTV